MFHNHSARTRINSPRRLTRKIAPALLAAAALLAANPFTHAASINEIWVGNTGTWELNTNWNPQTVPDNAADTYNVFIDNGVTGTNSVVTMNASHTINNLTVDLGDSLHIHAGVTFTIDNASNVTDNGTITVNDGQNGTAAIFAFTGGTLSGTGAIVLNYGGTYAQLNGTLTQSAGHTVQGWGQVNAALTNNGTVNANVNAQALTLQTSAMTNNSLFEATGNGTLAINGITVTQGSSGQIKADNAVVSLTGATVSKGTLNNVNGGYFNIVGSAATSTLDALTNNADLRLYVGNTLSVTGNLTDNGTITVNYGQNGTATYLTFDGGTLSGTGTVLLNYSGTYAQLDGTLTQSAGHTIQGWGQINAALTNNGTVNANFSSQALTLQTSAMTNNSLFEATGGATLAINGITVTQGSGGQIKADNATVSLTGATVSKGTLNSANGGFFNIVGSGDTTTLDTLTNNADLRLYVGNTLSVTGNLTDNGTITVNYAQNGTATYLTFAGGTLSGTGTVLLNYSGTYAQLNGTLTQSAGHTIQGLGQINAALTNNGTVNANASSQSLTLQTNAMTNNSLFEATGGATLAINGITVTQGSSGQIKADNATVSLTGATVSKGTLNSANGGFFNIVGTGATTTLDALTNNADLRLYVGNTLSVTGNLTDNGTITVNYAQNGAATYLTFAGGTLSGTGNVLLNYSNSSAQLNGSLIQSAGHTIQGLGQINAILTNHGTVNANSNANTLYVQGTSVTNTATMEATLGGTLSFLNSVGVTNTGGSITANGGNVVFSGSAAVTGGTLSSTGTNYLEADTASFTDVTIAVGSLLRTFANTTDDFTGTITNNGSILVNYGQNSSSTSLLFHGAANLNGTGSLTLNYSDVYAQLNTAASSSLTQAATHTIQGMGQINAVLTNNGTVNANVNAHALVLQTNAMTNNSLFEATSGGTLTINGITVAQGSVGQIKADGGFVSLTGATLSGGTLNSANSGYFSVTGGTSTFDGLTNNADVRVYANNTLSVTGDLTDNGTITVNYAQNSSPTYLTFNNKTLSGTGAVVLNYSGPYAQLNGTLTQAAGHTIQGFGQINAVLTNQGLVNANVSGVLGITAANSNTGTYEASNGGILNINGDLTQDDATTAGVLTAGTYKVLAGSTLAIAAPVTQHLTQIAADAVVILSGTNSIFTSGGGQIDTTLTSNYGELHILNRTFAAQAFTNAGLLQLGGGGSLPTGGGVFTAPSLINYGTIEATGAGDVLTVAAGITDPMMAKIIIDAGASLDISAGGSANAAVTLNHNGTNLNLGANNITVTGDYTNPNFDTTPGNPNTFNKHANVTTTTGKILAAPGSAGEVLINVTGTGVTNGATATPTISGLNAHVGVASTFNFQLLNTGVAGTNPTVRGAIQNNNVTSSQLTVAAADYTVLPGASTPFSVTFTPTAAGPIAASQSVHIANNFDNVPEQDITLTGAGYALASTTYNTTSITLPSVRVSGTFAAQSLSINNTLAAGTYNETLGAQFANAAGVTTAGSPVTVLAGAPANTALSVTLPAADTASPGAKSGTVDVQFNSQAVNSSGLGTTTLSPLNKTLTVHGSVFRIASVNTLATPINLGIIHPNGSFTAQALTITNTAANDTFSEGLDGVVTGTTPGASSSGSVTNLAAGSSSQINVGLGNASTAASGAKTGTVTIGFSTDGATTSFITAAPLTGPTASQIVTVNGQVNDYAAPAFHKAAGTGTLSNDDAQATSYTLDFGSQPGLASGSASINLANLLVASSSTFQDSLAGSFAITAGAGNFQLTGFGPITDAAAIAPNASQSAATVSYSNLAPGDYSETVTFTPISTTNGLSADAAIPTDPAGIAFNITLHVNPTPEPTSLALLGLGAAALLTRRRRH